MRIIIDKEIRELIPPLTKEELMALEQSLKTEGCRDALILWKSKDILLDGHHRYDICSKNGIKFKVIENILENRNDAIDWVIKNQLGRRNLTREKFNYLLGRLYLETKKPQGTRTDLTSPQNAERLETGDKIAKQYKLNHATVERAAAFANSVDIIGERLGPKVKEEILNRDIDITQKDVVNLARVKDKKELHAVYDKLKQEGGGVVVKEYLSEIKSEEKQKKLQEELKKAPPAIKWEGKFELNKVYLGDINKIELPTNSIDMIFTDPPYHDEYLELYSNLGKLAVKTLKPGAYCMVYCGKMFLPEILNRLTGTGLEYVWTCSVFHPFSQSKINKHHIFENWRPITIFKNPGETKVREWVQDVVRGERDKKYHEWQQDEEAPSQYISSYTKVGDIVLDPFVGGGTTPVVCKKLNRRYICFDKNEEAIKLTLMRLEENARE